jgi:hypothetical protein
MPGPDSGTRGGAQHSEGREDVLSTAKISFISQIPPNPLTRLKRLITATTTDPHALKVKVIPSHIIKLLTTPYYTRKSE